jgi:DNA invertase Pin-like site-specific DNA recombinase
MDKKSTWIYCRIDAPEDVHGALKGQYERLETYAAQMGFIVVGSSQDLGSGLNFDRSGLQSLLRKNSNGCFPTAEREKSTASL